MDCSRKDMYTLNCIPMKNDMAVEISNCCAASFSRLISCSLYVVSLKSSGFNFSSGGPRPKGSWGLALGGTQIFLLSLLRRVYMKKYTARHPSITKNSRKYEYNVSAGHFSDEPAIKICCHCCWTSGFLKSMDLEKYKTAGNTSIFISSLGWVPSIFMTSDWTEWTADG